MRRFLQLFGTIMYYCAWPAFWVYYKVGRGRTRVVLIYDDKVLVMKQWIGPGRWQLPGGGLHKGESMAGGAAREVLEETSLSLDPRQLQRIGRGTYRKHGHSFDYHVFVTRVGCNRVRAQRLEIAELKWVRPGELRRGNATPDTLRAIQMVQQKTTLLQ